MTRVQTTTPIPRHLFFVTTDGAYVVQRGETRVQDLLTGRQFRFDGRSFGHAITDYELGQLQTAGRVERFNSAYVWLVNLPEARRTSLQVEEQTFARVRAYYINTTLPDSEMNNVRGVLRDARLAARLMPIVRGEMIGIVKSDGGPFLLLKDAELAQQQLLTRALPVFAESVIAFIDVPAGHDSASLGQTGDLLDLKNLIASRTDISLTDGQRAVVACPDPNENQAILGVLREMKLDTRATTSGRQTLALLDEFAPRLLVLDLALPDLHAWQVLAATREMDGLRDLLTILLAEPGTTPDDQSFGVGVARVAAFMVKPLSLSRLRLNVWEAFSRHVGK